ncbi:hypothetical protein TNCV_2858551 [Trichonephila clavipes]|nr:hypothetical protein TNCV_2858551 [Trichonephila clavipes]
MSTSGVSRRVSPSHIHFSSVEGMDFRMAQGRETRVREITTPIPASSSAVSFPGTPKCDGIHWRHTCFLLPSLANLDIIIRLVLPIIFGQFFNSIILVLEWPVGSFFQLEPC